MRQGGNAIDAAVAAALMLGVVESHNSGIGGGCFILIRLPSGEVVAIDGRETAPVAATRDMYLVEGKAEPSRSQTGPLAAAVPGAVAAYEMALSEYGTLTFADLAVPATDMAANGFPVNRALARALQRTETRLSRFAGPRAIFFHADGTLFAEEEILKQPHLAETYRMLAKEGADWFYRGKFAHRVAKWMEKNGGLSRKRTSPTIAPVQRTPLMTQYRDYQIVGFPPPSSGGVHVAQIWAFSKNSISPSSIGRIQQRRLT